jgi:hypothetical protein
VHGQELVQDQGFVAGGAELLQFLRFDDDKLVGGNFIAPDDRLGGDGAVVGAMLGVVNALAAAGVQQMEVGDRGGADGGTINPKYLATPRFITATAKRMLMRNSPFLCWPISIRKGRPSIGARPRLWS